MGSRWVGVVFGLVRGGVLFGVGVGGWVLGPSCVFSGWVVPRRSFLISLMFFSS